MSTTTTTVDTTARKARPRDHTAVATALAAAFHADPVFGWLTPDEDQRRRILPTFFDLAVDIFRPHDDIWCVGEDDNGGVAGGALWSPAGVEPMDETAGQRFVSRCAELAGPDASRWEDVIALLDENHPHHTDHDYLWLLGVVPDQQGRGHGSAMLRAVLDRGDRDGVPTYLEATSRENLRLYERHGFRVTGELAVAGGPSLWAMWREPAR
ncbi:GNAT family N-acetyltransferase [Actinomycetospora lutea]|uniref:GNAT family N-acetyltransferase n=1 Tax=Actinomycetospora lutea TaxID=663604 RepID=UPI0023673965|nr:GNAT family N-acetyltransferase [Actinomycetospora lutea]MDD7939461.1 GNAT family N-acetyltransferase [Actinomycetospora lutea]